jgi:predicted ArsR family transcriptional regulator
MSSVTEAELLQQVQQALGGTADPEGAMSVKELSKALDITAEQVRDRLKELISQGSVEICRVPRTTMTGVVSRRYCYRLVRGTEDLQSEIEQS